MALVDSEGKPAVAQAPSPRGILSDYLQVHKFWLFDAAPIEAVSIPLFSPVAGFSGMSAPTLTVDTEEITEGNWPYKRKILKQASVGQITLRRGATFVNHDFYRWIKAALFGDTGGASIGNSPSFSGIGSIGGPTPRRTLVMIQFFPRNPLGAHPDLAVAAAIAGLSALAIGVGSVGGNVAGGAQAAALVAGGIGMAQASIGPFDRVPMLPARAWLLYGCLPSGYKASQDFDAKTGDVSETELTIECEEFDELSLSGPG